jgi:GNAT superfamily N-acetyltransferase
MQFRQAEKEDILQIQKVRHSVRENILSDPALVTDADCAKYLEIRGLGWVCEVEKEIVGFTIVDLQDHNVWALFVRPDFEHRGIGKKLHDLMLNRYFSITQVKIWLGTAPGTRAEKFYRKAGWTENGLHGKDEIKFEMDCGTWKKLNL